jgi:hypothetical protein
MVIWLAHLAGRLLERVPLLLVLLGWLHQGLPQ